MNRKTAIKVPKYIEVRGCRFVLCRAPIHWGENRLGELRCDRCNHPLAVLFEARNRPDVTPENPRWWIPSGVTCACFASSGYVALRAMPRSTRRRKQDKRQLEFPINEPTSDAKIPN
jgi:hypothetical protein